MEGVSSSPGVGRCALHTEAKASLAWHDMTADYVGGIYTVEQTSKTLLEIPMVLLLLHSFIPFMSPVPVWLCLQSNDFL